MFRILAIAAAFTLVAAPAFAQSSPAPKAMGSMHPAMKSGSMSHSMKSSSGSMKSGSMKGDNMKGSSMKGDHMKMKASPAPK